jgi:hypothetical protein
MSSSWYSQVQVATDSIRRVNSYALDVYDGMEIMIRSFYTPSVIGLRCTNLLAPGTPDFWMQRRRENVCSAGDQTPAVCTHIQVLYWESYSGAAMLYDGTSK